MVSDKAFIFHKSCVFSWVRPFLWNQGQDHVSRLNMKVAIFIKCPLRGHSYFINTSSCFCFQSGETACHVAARYGHVSVIEYLTSTGMDINIQDNVSSMMLLHHVEVLFIVFIVHLIASPFLQSYKQSP